jgi:hypothetical protein
VTRVLITALLLVLSTVQAGAATAPGYAGEWKFRVLLDGKDIGEHRFLLRADGPERELRSEARFDVRILMFNAYRYVHEATERWNGNCLMSLASNTDSNGDRESVRAISTGGRLSVERTGQRNEHDGCIMTFAYWNPQILTAKRLLNSQTGELVPVTIADAGTETLTVRGRAVTANRHRIQGPDLRIDIWYAGEQWIALEAPAKGGRRLRYELI